MRFYFFAFVGFVLALSSQIALIVMGYRAGFDEGHRRGYRECLGEQD